MSNHLNEIRKIDGEIRSTILDLRATVVNLSNTGRGIKDEDKKISILAHCFNIQNICNDLERQRNTSMELIFNSAETAATRGR